MRIFIAGGDGLIGKKLTMRLLDPGFVLDDRQERCKIERLTLIDILKPAGLDPIRNWSPWPPTSPIARA